MDQPGAVLGAQIDQPVGVDEVGPDGPERAGDVARGGADGRERDHRIDLPDDRSELADRGLGIEVMLMHLDAGVAEVMGNLVEGDVPALDLIIGDRENPIDQMTADESAAAEDGKLAVSHPTLRLKLWLMAIQQVFSDLPMEFNALSGMPW